MKNLSIFTRYDRLGASSRYRYFMYEKYLREGDYEPEYYNFYDDAYLRALYAGRRSFGTLPRAWLRRFRDLRQSAENMLIEYELFPFLPYWVDRMFLKHRRYVVNFDDNVWEKYAKIPWLRNKFDRIVANATGVIVANDFLYRKTKLLNDNVIKIPTVPDAALYITDQPKFEKFTIVWIGTPVTYRYLEVFADVLRTMSSAVEFELLVIASSSLKNIPGVSMRCVDWSPEVETELLGRSHVGIMPLTNEAFAQGKSAFKIIQYFAAGLPAVASPIGENCAVIQEGKNGFLPQSTAEWVSAIKKLSDQQLCQQMSEKAKESAQHLTIQHWQKILLDFLKF